LEKSKPALEGVSKEGDEMATANIGEIGVLKRVCSNSLAGLGSKPDRWGIRSRRNKLKKNLPLGPVLGCRMAEHPKVVRPWQLCSDRLTAGASSYARSQPIATLA